MKVLKYIYALACVIFSFKLSSQTKICQDIYMQSDPLHKPTACKNIVFKTNADGRVNDAIIEFLKNKGYNPISYNSLFPALRNYSKQEIDSVLNEKNIDVNVVIDLQASNFTSNVGFSSYKIGGSTFYSSGQNNTVNMFFSMFLFDVRSENPFARIDGHVYSEGDYIKRSRPLTIKFLNKAFGGLIEHGVILRSEKNT